ncbi:hypothetical protein [Veillonella intestinalis]|uniref:hypothetical protein n=1 Tax=Veillonella intestinalis TaxID=2941341 RepID=UPI002041263E|nr:hypothetical protein [Veillonella intestinalis]
MDLIVTAVVAVVVIYIIFKVAFYTVKKVGLNLILGYAAFYVCNNFFHIPVDMTVLMWFLTAVLGPIPVIVVALMHSM